MINYQKTFEFQRLPVGTKFTDEAIEFMKNNDEFIQYYHNYYNDDISFKCFREMVDERVGLREILRNGNLYSLPSASISLKVSVFLFCLFMYIGRQYTSAKEVTSSDQINNSNSKKFFHMNSDKSTSTIKSQSKN